MLVRRVTVDWLLCRLGARHGLVPAHHVRETVPLPATPSSSLPAASLPPVALPTAGLSASQPTSPDSQPTSPDGPPAAAEGQRVMALYDFCPQEKYDLGFKVSGPRRLEQPT